MSEIRQHRGPEWEIAFELAPTEAPDAGAETFRDAILRGLGVPAHLFSNPEEATYSSSLAASRTFCQERKKESHP